MKANTHIVSNWSQAVAQAELNDKHHEAARAEKLLEFKESSCDLFDMADFQYYSEETGVPVSQLLSMARYSDPQDYGSKMELQLLNEYL